MICTMADNIKLEIPRAAVEAIFDECDRYDVDETGGRILGTYRHSGRQLGIMVSGVIEPGPNAQRSQTYFKQDGEYQEKVFREIEERVAAIEHLGNWHTHHVNGLRHLSGGDIETYRRTVEHTKHNTNFFYALLVVAKNAGQKGLQRYTFKNYVMRRGDDEVYEIPASAVTLVDSPLVWPVSGTRARVQKPGRPSKAYARPFDGVANPDLIQDQDVISQFYPKIRILQSKELGIYWRGPITLADGSELEVIVLRDTEAPFECSVTLRDPPESLGSVVKSLGKLTFPSGRTALIAAERACNTQLVLTMLPKKRRRRRWMF
jgi:integrative and conjugative element protein (TIGR02256 family)